MRVEQNKKGGGGRGKDANKEQTHMQLADIEEEDNGEEDWSSKKNGDSVRKKRQVSMSVNGD